MPVYPSVLSTISSLSVDLSEQRGLSVVQGCMSYKQSKALQVRIPNRACLSIQTAFGGGTVPSQNVIRAPFAEHGIQNERGTPCMSVYPSHARPTGKARRFKGENPPLHALSLLNLQLALSRLNRAYKAINWEVEHTCSGI
jgi:hypothetical protein